MTPAHEKKGSSLIGLEAFLVTIAGFIGGFVSTLASNGSAVTLPALELFLPEHMGIA